jgi:hypothetical protein
MVGHYNGAKLRFGGPLARQASLFDEDRSVPLMLGAAAARNRRRFLPSCLM